MLGVNPDFGIPFVQGDEAYLPSFLVFSQELKGRERSLLEEVRSFEWTRALRDFAAHESIHRILEEILGNFVRAASSGDAQHFFSRFQDLGVRLFRSGYPPTSCQLLVSGIEEYLQGVLIRHVDDPKAQARLTTQTALAGQEALAILLAAYYEEQARVMESQLQRMAEKARITSVLSETRFSDGNFEPLLNELLMVLPCERVSLTMLRERARAEDELTSTVKQEVARNRLIGPLEGEETLAEEGTAVAVLIEGAEQPHGRLTVWFASPYAASPERRELVHWVGAELGRRVRGMQPTTVAAPKMSSGSRRFLAQGLSNGSRIEEFNLLLMKMALALRCARALLFRYDGERRVLQAEVGIDCDAPTLKAFSLPLDQFPLAKAAFDRSQTIGTMGKEQLTLPPAIRLRFDLRSAMAVPLQHGDAITGLVLFGDSIPERAFESEQLGLATLFGQTLALKYQGFAPARKEEPATPAIDPLETLSVRHQALEELARAVRHEVNNPLTGILGNTQLLLERKDLPAETYGQLREMEALCLRIRDILHELKSVKDQTAIYLGKSRMINLTTEPAQQSARPRALVVDDEPSIVKLLTTILSSEGYEVSSAGDGQGAINQLESNPYDLVLLDFKLPGMDGRHVFEAVKERRPDLNKKVIFVTGDTSTEETLKFVSSVGCRFLKKPFTLEELQAIISGSVTGN